MELIVVISLLCFSFFALQTPCTSLQIQQLQQSSNEQGAAKEGVQLSPVTLPRKLRFSEESVAFNKNGAHEHSTSYTKQKKEDVSELMTGKAKQKEETDRVRVHGRNGGGTMQQQRVDGPDISQYFTMDYSHVRRRRPIHNKSLPVSP